MQVMQAAFKEFEGQANAVVEFDHGAAAALLPYLHRHTHVGLLCPTCRAVSRQLAPAQVKLSL